MMLAMTVPLDPSIILNAFKSLYFAIVNEFRNLSLPIEWVGLVVYIIILSRRRLDIKFLQYDQYLRMIL